MPVRRKIKKRRLIRIPNSALLTTQLKTCPFRIPSTNIEKLESWIYNHAAGTTGPGDLEDQFRVHDSTSFYDKLSSFSRTDLTSPPPDHESKNSEPQEISPSDPNIPYQTVEVDLSEEEIDLEYKNDTTNMELTTMSEDNSAAAGDSVQNNNATANAKTTAESKEVETDQDGNQPDPSSLIRCELVASAYKSGIFTKCLLVIGWILCLSSIICSTVICCIFGARYGYKRTYDWIISFAICCVENCLVYQFIKTLIIMAIVTVLVNSLVSKFTNERS